MKNDTQISFRGPTEIFKRADALVEKLESRQSLKAFRVYRSNILRMALECGLELIEKENL